MNLGGGTQTFSSLQMGTIFTVLNKKPKPAVLACLMNAFQSLKI